jgi:hypothetical protein
MDTGFAGTNDMKPIVWTYELLDTIPKDLLLSYLQAQRARKRKTYTGGVFWKKHNPAVANCRCAKCMNRRAKTS